MPNKATDTESKVLIITHFPSVMESWQQPQAPFMFVANFVIFLPFFFKQHIYVQWHLQAKLQVCKKTNKKTAELKGQVRNLNTVT